MTLQFIIFLSVIGIFIMPYNLTAIDDSNAISSNPGAVNIENGTGALGERLGFEKGSGIRIGALLIEDLNYLLAGGLKPKKWSGNSVFILSLNLDTEKLRWWSGGNVGIEFLQFNGSPTNREAGTVQGYNSLTGPPPFRSLRAISVLVSSRIF